MNDPSPRALGDAIALARLSWVHESTRRISARGYDDFRRSDTAALRRLLRGPASQVELARALHVSRQAARKVLSGLHARGYVTISRDPSDSRRTLVELTTSGRRYASVVIDVATALNAEASLALGAAERDTTLKVLAAVSAQWRDHETED